MTASLDPELKHAIEQMVAENPVIATLAKGRPNEITGVGDEGVRVKTERSADRGVDDELVEAWMFNAAWDQLRRTGSLTNRELLHDLNVKRSSAVCAILSRLPSVSVAGTDPIELRFERQGAAG